MYGEDSGPDGECARTDVLSEQGTRHYCRHWQPSLLDGDQNGSVSQKLTKFIKLTNLFLFVKIC